MLAGGVGIAPDFCYLMIIYNFYIDNIPMIPNKADAPLGVYFNAVLSKQSQLPMPNTAIWQLNGTPLQPLYLHYLGNAHSEKPLQ